MSESVPFARGACSWHHTSPRRSCLDLGHRETIRDHPFHLGQTRTTLACDECGRWEYDESRHGEAAWAGITHNFAMTLEAFLLQRKSRQRLT